MFHVKQLKRRGNGVIISNNRIQKESGYQRVKKLLATGK